MAAKKKYYVVWAGQKPGVYDNWGECKEQVDHFEGAKYKSFETQEAAVSAATIRPRQAASRCKY